MLKRTKKPTIGIIGRGNFAQLLTKILKSYASEIDMIGRSSSESERVKVFNADIIILSVTFDAYPKVLKELQPKLKENSLLVDVCSIKVKPLSLIQEFFPGHKNLLITHPLFGPQSARKSTKNLKLIVCQESGQEATKLLNFCQEKLKLNLVRMSPEEHDKAMAYTHALTFFVSEALHPFQLQEHGITTPSFAKLLSLSQVASLETRELLNSVHKDNPFAGEVRDKFADHVDKLRDQLDNLT